MAFKAVDFSLKSEPRGNLRHANWKYQENDSFFRKKNARTKFHDYRESEIFFKNWHSFNITRLLFVSRKHLSKNKSKTLVDILNVCLLLNNVYRVAFSTFILLSTETLCIPTFVKVSFEISDALIFVEFSRYLAIKLQITANDT